MIEILHSTANFIGHQTCCWVLAWLIDQASSSSNYLDLNHHIIWTLLKSSKSLLDPGGYAALRYFTQPSRRASRWPSPRSFVSSAMAARFSATLPSLFPGYPFHGGPRKKNSNDLNNANNSNDNLLSSIGTVKAHVPKLSSTRYRSFLLNR